jgi:RNA polymerase sigma-70 factor (ECF subfamily)
MDVAPGAVTATPPDRANTAATEQRVTEHYERRGRELWGLARRLGATEEQAADAVQEVHLRLWHEFHKGAAIADVDAWSFRVLYRLVMDQHRIGRRVQGLVGRLIPGHIETVTHSLDDGLSLWPLVDQLPERERATLYLRYRADLSYEQIGQVMGITAASGRAYASRGIERLRGLVIDPAEGSTR